MLRVLAALAVAAALLAGGQSPASAADEAGTVCRFPDDRYAEISGMTYSLLHRDVIWVHNDSGGGPYIYAVDSTTCRTLARVTIAGIEARDIEAIATGRDRKGRPVLWVGDLGDNRDSWPEVFLHRIREPRVLVDRTVTPRTYRVTYRDRPHDAETLLADPTSTRLWIVTKQLAHGRLYELPDRLSRSEVNVARPVHQEGGLVTDGAVSPDGSRYVLRDYLNARILDGLPQGTLAETVFLPLQPQGEAVTWTSDGRALLIASERDDRLQRVEVSAPAAVVSPPDAVDSSSSEEAGTASPITSTIVSSAGTEPGGRSQGAWGVAVLVGAVVVAAVVTLGVVAASSARRRRRAAAAGPAVRGQ